MPGLIILLAFYLICLGLLFYYDFWLVKKRSQFETLLKKYEAHLSQNLWTQVFLKPSPHNKKHSNFMSISILNDLFYAKLAVKNSHFPGHPLKLLVLVAYIDDAMLFTEDMEYNLKFTPKSFEEYFCYEKYPPA